VPIGSDTRPDSYLFDLNRKSKVGLVSANTSPAVRFVVIGGFNKTNCIVFKLRGMIQ
jgi:hypothetical protein